MEISEEMHDFMERCDSLSAKQLYQFDENIWETGLYQRAAHAFVPPPSKKGSVHVNMYGNYGHFSIRTQEIHRDLHVLDIQPCHSVAEIFGLIPGVRSSVASCLEAISENMIRRQYQLEDPDMQNVSFSSLPPALWVIHDDVRSASVIRKILGSQRVQSASLMFPKITIDAFHHAPYPAMHDNALPASEMALRAEEIQKRMATGAFTLAAEIVEPGGKLIVGQLSSGVPQRQLSAGLQKASIDLGHFKNDWEPDSPPIIERSSGFPNFPDTTADIFRLVRR